ncbi:hypothetical protein DRJ17_02660 [Candidatus Woesearchaeota archaeon]|nr:MAG: hypothetical protein DRJ17_02660 [Candidatus Woesearchaeota archaeon]
MTKRKLVALGGSTLMVSLPSRFVQSYGLKKGDEVTVTEQQHSIVISTDKDYQANNIQLDVSGIKNILGRIVGALYKAGYDDIELRFKSTEELALIQKELQRTCLGFEVMEQGKNHIVIKNVSKLDDDEFKNILRRAFLFLLDFSRDTLDALKTGDKDYLERVALRDIQINKYMDFCRRTLNKRGAAIMKMVAPMYYILEQIERIGDIYKYICTENAKNPIKIDSHLQDLFEDVNEIVYNFYQLFYKFNLKSLDELATKKTALQSKLNSLKNKDHNELVFRLNQIVNNIYDMNGALMMLNL